MQYTLSLHNGGQSTVRQDHNARRYVPPNADASRTGGNICLRDMPIRVAYDKLFRDALADYNKRQVAAGHRGRQIDDYYSKMSASTSKQAAYELVVQIGGRADGGAPDQAVQALKAYCRGWAAANPHLACIGAYIHVDEETPHLHLDYIPVADAKRGLRRQNSLSGALKAQGFVSRGARDTAQIQWEQAERDRFRSICRGLGIDVAAQGIGRKRHLTVEEYKAVQDNVAAAKQDLAMLQAKQFDAEFTLGEMESGISSLDADGRRLQADIAAKHGELARLDAGITDRRGELSRLDKGITDKRGKLSRLDTGITVRQDKLICLNQDIGKAKALQSDIGKLRSDRDRLAGEVEDLTQQMNVVDEDRRGYWFANAIYDRDPDYARQVERIIDAYGWDSSKWPDGDIDNLIYLLDRLDREDLDL